MKITTPLLIFSLFAAFGAWAQIVNENRIEFQLKDDYDSYSLSSFEEHGLLLYANHRSENHWKVDKYDHDLKLQKSINIDVDNKQSLAASAQNEEKDNLLFKDKKNRYVLYNISSVTLQTFQKSGVLPKKAILNSMLEYNNIVYMDMTKSKKDMLLMVNYNTDMQSVVPLTFPGYKPHQIIIYDMQVIPEYKEVLIYVRCENKNTSDIFVIKLDENGEKTETLHFHPYSQKRVKTVSATAIENGEYLFTGTYSDKSGSTAQGMFISHVAGQSVKFISYFNFLDFEDFFSYMSEKKQEKMEKKIEKKKKQKEARGKELTSDYFMTLHEVKQMGDQYMVLGEAYFPTYRTVQQYNAASKTWTSYQVFDGYQYTHGTLAAFNLSGEKLWDRTFPLQLMEKPFYIKKHIKFNVKDDQIDLMYASGKSLHLMTVSEDNDLKKDLKSDFIKTDDEEKIKRSYSNLQYWYGDYFLAYGEQKIKGDEKAKTKNRSVFFINKIGVN